MSWRRARTHGNPFSTRHVRPGALEFIFPADQSADQLVRRLERGAWRGQILGAHGSGKSTLLAALVRPLESAGRKLWTVCLRDGESRMPRQWTTVAAASGANLIVIDGYEQLRFSSRVAVKHRCRIQDWGLLVTAHAEAGLPTVYRTAPNERLVFEIAARLLGAGSTMIDRDTIARHFAVQGNNVRETLFALYDEYEQRGLR